MSEREKTLASVPPEKRALLMRALQQKAARPKDAPIPRRPKDAPPAPLSFAQQRLWFLDQLEPGGALFNIPTALRLTGPLDVALLERCLGALIERHPALRTTFRGEASGPVQHVAPADLDARATVPVIDLSGLTAAARDVEARRRIHEEAQRPFDLAQGPLLRTVLFRLAPEEHVLLATMHHIVTDGWSMGLLVREVMTLYAAFASGQPSPLATLVLDYADYAEWQRGWLRGEPLEKQLGYWRQQLAGSTALDLPTDRPRPAVQSHRGSNHPLRFPKPLSEAFKALCAREGATPFMGFLSAWQLLLSRYSGQEEISIGSPIAGRNRAELEPLIGFFVNTLVFRSQVAPERTFRELLAQVKRTTLDAYAHQDIPLDKVVEALQPARDLSRPPLFQSLFVLQNAPMPALALAGLTVQGYDLEARTAEFDASLMLVEQPDGFIGALEYNSDLFDAETALRMAGALRTLLEGIVATPDVRLRQLPIATPAERSRVIAASRGEEQRDPPLSVPALFEAQTTRTPESLALRDGAVTLTYAELNRRANQLARHLRARGLGAGQTAGLLLERSADTLIGFLAVLKLGAAYVPLDPEYPRDRLELMLRDSGARLLLTRTALLDRLGAAPIAPEAVVDLGAVSVEVTREPDGDLGLDVPPDALAYLMYTSGSTGVPKAVMTSHRALVSYARGNARLYGLRAQDRALQFSSLSFDNSSEEIFPLWLTGGAVVLRNEAMLDPAEFCARCAEWGVSLLFLPTAFWIELTTALSRGAVALPASIRVVATGGEKVPASQVLAWRRAGPTGVRLANEYGPTEATVISVVADLDPVTDEALAHGAVPIGRPSPGVRAYVLDRWMQPVPDGLRGELYLGGDCLARGYHGRPELTAERFVPDPLSHEPGARLYRTGDLVVRRASGGPGVRGALEYLGRADDQVKLRGYRIELGEIEAALARQPGVNEAVVTVREDVPGDRRLVGYVTARSGPLDPAALRRALREQLPEHMVPSALVALEAFPLTPNGKVDRRALPAPDAEAAATGRAYVEPRTPTETLVAGIWASLLNAERLGADDHFFERGGHSLLATQAMARVRAALQIDLPLRELFEAPTVAALSERIDRALARGRAAATPPLVPAPRTGPLPLSFAQQRLWFVHQLDPTSPAYNLPAVLRLRGALDVDALQRSLDAIAHRHEALRTTFEDREGGPVQHVHPPSPVPLQRLDLTALTAPERHTEALRRAQEEALRPFDLVRGPLLRGLLIRLGEREHLLAVVMHHIVSDGWSMGLMVREVMALYPELSAGRPAALPPLAVQYADYAVWQRGWLQGAALEAELAYWRAQLDGAPDVLALPGDRPRPAVRSDQGASLRRMLPRALADALQGFSQREGVTPFMTLLAAFAVLLGRSARQDDVVVGTDIANRSHAATEGLIGFFVNQLALRTSLAGDPPFRALLRQVRDTALGAYAHQDLPFEELIRALNPTRSRAHAPVFQVKLTYQNTPMAALEVPGLAFEGIDTEQRTARQDLALLVADDPEGLACGVEYSTDLFDEATVHRLIDALQVLLGAALARPDERISRLPLLTDAERTRALAQGEAVGLSSAGHGATVISELEAQVARTPDAPAVIDGATVLTFTALDQRANQLAHHLRSLGVGPESRVALSLERSADQLVALVAILKAGGAYVPIDPVLPEARRELMERDAGARVRVDRALLEAAPLAVQRDRAPLPRPHPSQLAYVVYTSGSTGTPKGVMVSHQAVLDFRSGLARTTVSSAQPLRVSMNAPLSFDASVQQWVQLLEGHAVCVVPGEARRDVDALMGWLGEARVDVLDCTPSHLRVMLDAGLLSHPAAPRWVLVGGEAIDDAMWATLRRSERTRFFNVYGPTESTVDATAAAISESGPTPTLGRALAGVEAHVLGPDLEPVPPNVPGELHLGGAQLARGYLGRPELTAERFIPHPFSREPGARLYRTGDLCRRRADGTLEYVGRTDLQVKVRGFRIELGEIEAALAQHPTVRDAVVVAQGGSRLVGYVTPREGATLDPVALRDALRARLPEYMVPAVLVPLDRLPLNASGKVDRRALPVPDLAPSGHTHVPPRTPTETTLAELWRALLGVERVGATDDFFALGGHSLLATQLVSRLRGALQVELPLVELFEAPTVEGLARRIDARLQAKLPSALPPITPRPEDAPPAPLTFGQQRLWFLERLAPGGAAFHIPFAVRLEGALDVAALQGTLERIAARHEPLRTTFVEGPEGPVQHVQSAGPLPLPLTQLASSTEEELRRHVEAEALRPFDLARGPLLRAALLRVAPDAHVLLLTVHHIAFDGWSTGVLIQEMAALYPALAAGRTPTLPPLPIRYADYAAWQRQWLDGETLEKALGYWRQQLDGAAALELPTDRPRPAHPAHRGAMVEVRLSREVSEGLAALCRREGVTPFMALLAAFQLLLARHAGQDDVSVGSPVAGRDRAELEGLIGYFLNTIVLRTRLDGDPTVRALLARVRDVALGAFAHQHVPFEELQPLRDLEQAPLFRAMFILQNLPDAEVTLPGLTLRPLAAENDTAKLDLTLTFNPTPDGFAGTLEYDVELFDRSTATRLARRLEALVGAMVATPERRLSALPTLDAQERYRLLVTWNNARAPFPDACLHTLFEAQALRTPEALAIGFEAERLTYAELDRRANQLAHHLRARGVGPEVIVGLSVERSPAMVVGLLGVLKAGGAYLPLDPTLPPERLAYMLQDSGARLLITEAGLRDRFGEAAPLCVLLDQHRETIERERNPPPYSTVTPANLAYVIYTSGSTGRPKGTVIAHRGVANLVTQEARAYGLGPGSRLLQVANLSFDLSVEEIFTTLCAGGTLWLARADQLLPGRPLQTLLRERAITAVSLTPAALAATPADDLPALRTVISGGEACSAEVVARWAPGRRFLNTYGPTEATVIGTLIECVADGTTPSIGRPLANVRAYVVAPRGAPVPVGVRGELLLGGPGLARGYLGQPGLTAEKFVPDPFGTEPGARLYRTGDLVRWREDGTLEFAGRIDAQVKLRGFRIELGEVESALRALEGVREAVVVAREDGPAGKRLIAYVTPALDAAPLRDALRTRLPEYMVPAAIVALDALPLTSSGKIDRRALPEPDAPASGRAHVPPRTPTEVRVAELFAQLLGAKQVGAHDHFFELGGHSLLATQAVARIRTAFGVELPLRGLFEGPTVEEVAKQIDAALAGTAPSLPRVQWSPRDHGFPVEPLEEAARRLATHGSPSVRDGVLDLEAADRAIAASNQTDVDLPRDACIHHLFAAQAARTPNVDALAFGDVILTYAELERRANQLAHHLRSLGVGPEVRVALCVERSPELVIGMLGVLKAGGAYVPLDPAYPAERLAFMVRDAGAPVTITQRHLRSAFPLDGQQVVLIDEDAAIARQPSHPPEDGARADGLAYVIYTSGSTGRPKGTLLQHRGLCNTALAAAHLHGFHPRSRVLQFAASSFDASVCEVFSTFLAGACLVLAPRDQLLPGGPLRALLEGQRITAVTLTPSVLAQLEAEGLPLLETIISAGEPCTPELARRWTRGRTLLNAYGPTEVTVCATITRGSVRPDPLTIGRPWNNVRAYVLDDGGKPVPPGVAGELYLASVGLARGYLHRPDLTAERFVPDPFGTAPGGRLYRTGDRARWLADGELESLGRIDAQVKLRGFRIELGEIEVCLAEQPAVREVAVLLREDSPGDRRLVAYIAPRAGHTVDATALRTALRSRVPEHMVPAAFVLLDALPLTPSGKVNREALPVPDGEERTAPFAAPRTDLERQLAGIWEQVLRVDRIGLHDPFFSLGGHSLSATQVVARVRQSLGRELSLAELFQAGTIEALAVLLEARAPAVGLTPPLTPAPRNAPLPLSFAQQRLWFLDRLDPGGTAYHLPTAVRLEGPLDVAALTEGFRTLQERHEALRTTFRPDTGDGVVQVVTNTASLPAEWIDLSALPEAQREQEVLRFAQDALAQPFDLEQGPLWRVTLLHLSERQQVLLLTMHHIISDAWSMGVLIQEMAALYAAGRSAPLPPPTLQYADYAVWQRAWLRDEALDAQVRWWRQELDGLPAALDLPTDRPRPAAPAHRGGAQPFSLSREETDAFLAFCRREGVTPFMASLAAFQALLGRWASQDDLAIGSPIAGRGHAELESLIGFFVNTLVLRARLTPEQSFRTLLAQVRETTLGAYAHQDVPFEKLVEALRPVRDPRRSPLFQVMFAYQNAPLPEGLGPELRLLPIELEQQSAKFELTLTVTETARGLEGALEFDADLLEPATAALLTEALRAVIVEALQHPDRPLATLAALSQAEQAGSALRTKTAAATPPPLAPVERTGPLPLSFAQQRLWFLDQLEPGSASYNVPSHAWIEGALDADALERALEEVLRRHEALRTTFVPGETGPVQVIGPVPTQPLRRIDLTHLAAGDHEAEARRWASEELQRPFELATGPLLRAVLLRFAPDRHALLLTVHHISADGWSTGLLAQELSALYDAFVHGRPSPLPALPLQYADYASWQRRWLEGPALEAQVAHWRRALDGAPRVLELPTDRPRPAVLARRGTMLPVRLSPLVSGPLQALCREERATPFMALLAVFQALLGRWSGQDDLSIGTPIAGRGHAELEPLIGFFVNTLVLRARLTPALTFRQLLAQVRGTALDAYAHADVPFEKLVEALRPERDLGRAPLFQALFTLQPAAAQGASFGGDLALRPIEPESRSAKFELSLDLAEGPDGLSGGLELNTELFDVETGERLIRHYEALLLRALASPDVPLAQLALTDDAEARKLHTWGQGAPALTDGTEAAQTVFEAQVDRAPDASALVFGDETRSYREVESAANRLAHHLRAHGVGPEVRVGLCLEPSLERVIGLLAILKAGGVYVPLDPNYPPERLAFLRSDAQLSLTVDAAWLEREGSAIASRPEHRPPATARGDQLAYVIYTSGSTGRPKGTLLTHRGLTNTARAAAKAHGFHTNSRVLQFASINFDASLCEVFGAFAAGACVVLARREEQLPGEPLHTFLRDRQITAVTLTPSVLASLNPHGLPTLETVISAGEACPPELARRWNEGRRLLNAYGPTEITVCAAITDGPVNPERITIGRAWAGTRLHVLEAPSLLAPIGVPGELYVGGVGVARGYLGRPDLTAERFVPDPFATEPGARLYRTGDRVRWLADGQLEYLGRADQQVKLRGIRIELGEIESTVRAHPQVREAAVVLHRAPGGAHDQDRLVAYVVLAADAPSVTTLRDFLRDRLPEALLPSAILALPSLPLTPNGKLDRAALPAPDAALTPTPGHVPPRDALEWQVAQVFEALLQVRPIGAHSHFFELGGHSLLAVRLVAELRKRTGRSLPVAALFQAPTVAQLADRLRADPRPWTPLVPIQPQGARPPLFLVHPVGGTVLAYAELARALGPEQPVYGLEAQGLDGDLPPLRRVDEQAALYLEALRAVQPTGPYHLGGWSMGGVVAFEMARQLQARGETVALLALIDPSPASSTDPLFEQSATEIARLFAHDVASLAGVTLPPDTASDPDQLLAQLIATAGTTLPELPQLRALLAVFTANLDALRHHTPGQLHGPVTILRATDSPDADSPDRGWSAHAPDGLELEPLPGDHYALLRPPALTPLAEALRRRITPTPKEARRA